MTDIGDFIKAIDATSTTLHQILDDAKMKLSGKVSIYVWYTGSGWILFYAV